jgi:hypothetical protein
MKNRFIAATVFNCAIFALTLFSIISMMAGFQFMDNTTWEFSASNFAAFRYFTVDSNILAGIVALVYLIYSARNKRNVMPRWLSFLKLAATTGVTLTMMVTVCFLAPVSDRGFFALFKNSNLFLHFVIPVLCIISFIFFEPVEKQLRFSHTLIGIIPMFIYSIFYTTNVLLHLENGKPTFQYDLYGFLGGKLSNIWFVMPAIYSITWLFSILLWFGNKKVVSKK